MHEGLDSQIFRVSILRIRARWMERLVLQTCISALMATLHCKMFSSVKEKKHWFSAEGQKEWLWLFKGEKGSVMSVVPTSHLSVCHQVQGKCLETRAAVQSVMCLSKEKLRCRVLQGKQRELATFPQERVKGVMLRLCYIYCVLPGQFSGCSRAVICDHSFNCKKQVHTSLYIFFYY